MILLYEEEIVRFIFTYDIRQQVYLVGDFNDWDEKSLPMQPIKWHWILDIYLSQGEYEFKYLAGKQWWNDNEAHKYVPNCWGSENSVVIVQPNYQLKSKGLSCPEYLNSITLPKDFREIHLTKGVPHAETSTRFAEHHQKQ